jgi:L-gulonate 5-dehydrogenase
MKSILVEGPRKLRIAEFERPRPAAGEVRVKVRYAGICGSDIHIFHGTHPFVRYPRIIGHEFAGVIDAVGQGVEASRIGERVSVTPVVSCGHCYPCSVGRPNVCATVQVLGVHREGGFSEFCCVPENLAYPVPDNVSDTAAATVEPFSIGANMLNRTGVLPQDTGLVYGAGPIGLTVIQTLKGVYRMKRLVVVDRVDSRLEMAKQSGADIVVNNADRNLADILKAEDIVPTLIIDAACHPSILEEAIELASPAGRIGMMGFSPEPSRVSQRKLNAKELTLYASRLNNLRFGPVIDWMSKGLLHPDKFISHTFKFTEVSQAFDLSEKDPFACCKILLDFTDA